MFIEQFVTLALCVLPTLAAPSPLVPVTKTGNAVAGRYIITFKNGIARPAGLSSVTSRISSRSKITHEWDVINGFAGTIADSDLDVLRSNPNVASIQEDGLAHTQGVTTQ